MKVMLMSGRYPPEPCGIGDYTYKLANDLNHHGHHVTVLSSIPTMTGVDTENKDTPVETIRTISSWDFQNFRQIINVVKERNIDIIHIQYQSSFFDRHPMMTLVPFYVFLKSLRGKKRMKIVVTMHEFGGPTHTFLPRSAGRIWLLPLLMFSHAIIVTNEYHLSSLRKVPMIRNKVKLIPSGSNIEVPKQLSVDKTVIRKKMGLSEEDILLVRFGFVDSIRFRQLDLLLYALQRVSQKGHRVKMLFVGGHHPESRTEMENLAKLLAIEECLLWSGFCPPEEVATYLACADIGVFPFSDGVCERRTSLLAALAFGLPVVTTKRKFHSSFFVNRENVLLVPPGDSIALADAIEELIDKEDLREKLSSNARLLSKEFCWKKIGHATDVLYRSLVSNS